MASTPSESLVRRRRAAFLALAAGVTIPVAFMVRRSGEWTTFGVAAVLLVVLILLGSVTMMGPWQRSAHDWEPGLPPDPDPAPGSGEHAWKHLRRNPDEGEQLALSLPRQSRIHARR